jgi:hypothetical protein
MTRRIASKWPNMGLQRPPYAWEVRGRVVWGYDDCCGVGFCWSLRSKISCSTAVSLTGLLESQLRQVQQVDMRRLVPHIVLGSHWLVMWKRAYSPRHDAPSTKNDAKRTGGSEVTAFRVHQQGQCKCQCASSRPNIYGPPAYPHMPERCAGELFRGI